MSAEIKEMLWKIKRQNTYDDIGYFRTPLSNEDADKFLKYIEDLQQKVEQLENIRKEAIEYIEGFYYPDERQLTHEFDGWNLAKLYDILNKGDNKEWNNR